MWGIAFTGHSDEKDEYGNPLIPCPSEQQRPLEIINKWHGNVPVTKEEHENRS